MKTTESLQVNHNRISELLKSLDWFSTSVSFERCSRSGRVTNTINLVRASGREYIEGFKLYKIRLRSYYVGSPTPKGCNDDVALLTLESFNGSTAFRISSGGCDQDWTVNSVQSWPFARDGE